jgi:predicted acylesterase/phospholipase RssA
MLIPPRRIMLSGGGSKTLTHVGAIDELEARGYLRSVKEWMGTSAGAFIALCKTVGYTQKELRDIALKFDFHALYSPDVENLLDYGNRLGVDDGVAIRRFVESCLRIRGYSPDITFRGLAERGRQFRCFAANLNTLRLQEFSARRSPDMSVVTAVLASMSVPFYFRPIRDEATGHLFTDGGIMDDTPLELLTPSEQIETLVLAFYSAKHREVDSISSVADFIGRIYGCAFIHQHRKLQQTREQVCFIDTGNLNWWEFEMTEDQRRDLIQRGRQSMAAFIESTADLIKRPPRRWSVS